MNAAKKFATSLDGIDHFSSPVKWQTFAELGKCSDTGGSALDVGVIDHNISKHLTRIEQLVPAGTSIIFVRGPATVSVMQRQNDVTCVTQTVAGDALRLGNQSRTAVTTREVQAKSCLYFSKWQFYTMDAFVLVHKNGSGIGRKWKLEKCARNKKANENE